MYHIVSFSAVGQLGDGKGVWPVKPAPLILRGSLSLVLSYLVH